MYTKKEGNQTASRHLTEPWENQVFLDQLGKTNLEWKLQDTPKEDI